MRERPDYVWLAFAFSAICAALLAIIPALADAPPQQLVKPVARCDEKNCTISKADWMMFQEFHESKFREIQATNVAIEQAQEELAKLRALLVRLGGNCNDRRRS